MIILFGLVSYLLLYSDNTMSHHTTRLAIEQCRLVRLASNQLHNRT